MATRAGASYTYGDANHDHAVTQMGASDSYTYDNNRNQQTHSYSGDSYTYGYNQENRLITGSGSVTATFYYDGDGNRVKGTAGGTTYYIGNPSLSSGQGYFEWTGSANTMNVKDRYYYAGGTRVAERTGGTTLNYLLGDHSLVPRDKHEQHGDHHQQPGDEPARGALLPRGRGA